MFKYFFILILGTNLFAFFLDDIENIILNNNVNYTFNAKDVNRNDKNISTKKIGKDINLTIFCDKSFSGTVYSVIQENDNNISDVNKTNWNNETEKNVSFKNIKKISKDAYIHIEWED